MPYSHTRTSRLLVVLGAALLIQSSIRAVQSNPKLESAYDLPHASHIVEVPRLAEDDDTDVSRGTAASIPIDPSQSEQLRLIVWQGAKGR